MHHTAVSVGIFMDVLSSVGAPGQWELFEDVLVSVGEDAVDKYCELANYYYIRCVNGNTIMNFKITCFPTTTFTRVFHYHE